MLHDFLQEVMTTYPPQSEKHKFKQHPLGPQFRKLIPDYLDEQMKEFPNLKWSGSMGQGNLARVPWVAGLHEIVTDSIQKGYYPVYLFECTMNSVYLSLNQGVSDLSRRYNDKETMNILVQNSQLIRAQIKSKLAKRFKLHEIKLTCSREADLALKYERGHIIGIQYHANGIPKEAVLLSDLRAMLEIYSELVFWIDSSLLNGEDVDSIIPEAVEDPQIEVDKTSDKGSKAEEIYIEETRRKFHSRIERNRKLAKAVKRARGYICEVCRFDYEKIYGEMGHKYIEAHHVVPISTLPENAVVSRTTEDFRVLCANCHRMIHSSSAPATFEEFLTYFQRRNNLNP
jgi:5-methylcytosine-specific restriction protein A